VHFAPADPATLLETAQRHRAGRLYAIPAVWARILDHGVDGYDLSSLHEADTGTSATPPELIAAIRDALPHTVTRIFYGSTEAGPATILGTDDLASHPGAVGRAQPTCEVRLGARGEVCVRNPFLMDGYFDNPDATAEALADGWYHTGDLGAFDDDGYLSIVGRARDVIRSGGETIAPVEIEQVLAAHPAFAEVAVVGVPDAQWGEIVTACVVIATDAAEVPDVDALRAWCGDRLASFKHPRRIVVVDALPRTPATGQVQRTLIVERIVAS
jgi:acyl-CoA synthetase (AMP-forming)/AMP-acid ligase II